jgi:hypothetical protein
MTLPSIGLWNAGKYVVKAEYRPRYFQPRATVTAIAAAVDGVSFALTLFGERFCCLP